MDSVFMLVEAQKDEIRKLKKEMQEQSRIISLSAEWGAKLSAENERLREEAARWHEHGSVLIEIISDLVDDAVSLGRIDEHTQARIAAAIDAMEVSDGR